MECHHGPRPFGPLRHHRGGNEQRLIRVEKVVPSVAAFISISIDNQVMPRPLGYLSLSDHSEASRLFRQTKAWCLAASSCFAHMETPWPFAWCRPNGDLDILAECRQPMGQAVYRHAFHAAVQDLG
jgi:hypothetical protein